LRLLPDATCAHQPGSVDSPKITLVSLAAVAERAQPLQRTAPSGRTQGQCSGCRRFADGVLAHVGTPGGSTSTAQPLLRLTRSPPTPCLCPSLTRSNRRGTRPVCPVVGEGWHREVSPYPDLCVKSERFVTSGRVRRQLTAGRLQPKRGQPASPPRAGISTAPSAAVPLAPCSSVVAIRQQFPGFAI